MLQIVMPLKNRCGTIGNCFTIDDCFWSYRSFLIDGVLYHSQTTSIIWVYELNTLSIRIVLFKYNVSIGVVYFKYS